MSYTLYDCPHCPRKYRSKFNYDRHLTGCAFFSKSMKEQLDEVETMEPTPTPEKMYRFIQELAVRITGLEQDNTKLKQQLNKKFHILDWLNNDSTIKPNICFDQWFNTKLIPNIPDMLDTVFNSNLINGINTLFNNEFDSATANTLPIRAFNHHTTSLFIFQKQDTSNVCKWIKVSSKDLIPWFRKLCNQFIVVFNTHWCQKHTIQLEHDETYKDLYISYYYKILGNNSDSTVIHNKIRLNIFQKIKENITQINY